MKGDNNKDRRERDKRLAAVSSCHLLHDGKMLRVFAHHSFVSVPFVFFVVGSMLPFFAGYRKATKLPLCFVF